MAKKMLAGKVAVVTGGSRGLGTAIAHALADEGANVVITYIASADKANAVVEGLQAKGVKAAAIQNDQGDTSQAKPLLDRVVSEFGGLDILVNNAALAIQGRTIDDPEIDNDALDRQWQVNVHGVIANIRAAAQLMTDGGRIITIGSGAGTRAGFAGTADYAGTKAAINGYSKGVARDLGPRNITVNVVQSGIMETEMAAGLPEETRKMLFSTLSLQRFARLEEVAAAVTFLASPAASYVTGSIMDAEGGYGA